MKGNIKIIAVLSTFLLLLSGCNSKLENGKEAVVKFNESGITTNEFYKVLKEKYGIEELVNMMDSVILNDKYKVSATEIKYVNESIESIKSQAGENFLGYIKQYYHVNSEQELKDFLGLNFKRSTWIKDYTKSIVTKKEIETYYNDKVVGDMELSHILITPNVKSDATSDEKKAAEKIALDKAKEVIAKLNSGEKFEDLAKTYSEDNSNKNTGGKLGFINRAGYDENFIEGAIPLKVKQYTKEPIKSQFGYHIIMKTNEKKKEELDKVKDSIIETISEEKLKSDSTLQIKAMEKLRNDKKMKIKDSTLNKDYVDYINNLYKNNNK